MTAFAPRALSLCAVVGLVLGCSGGGADPIQLRSAGSQAVGGTGGSAGALADGGGTPGDDETGGSGSGTGGKADASGGNSQTGGSAGASDTGGSAGASDTGGTPGTGGNGDAGAGATGGTLGRCPILPNEFGSVKPEDNECGIQGDWYAYNDYLDCFNAGFTDCIEEQQQPTEGEFPNVDGRMCTVGDTQVPASEDERRSKWGAGIGLNLNQGSPISGLPRTIVGFEFTISTDSSDADVPQRLQVNFPTPETAKEEYFADFPYGVLGGHEVYLSEDLRAPDWVAAPLDFDPSQVLKIQFYVPTETGMSVHYDFCIENLTAIYEEAL